MVSSASDSWPTYPVTTTTDRATIAIDKLTTKAVAQSSGTVSSTPAATTTDTITAGPWIVPSSEGRQPVEQLVPER